uniref:Secreted protein n=1 Tax=Opuntia streptacantha TaxID=393608 RepID=A0A7C9A6A2_OPUST
MGSPCRVRLGFQFSSCCPGLLVLSLVAASTARSSFAGIRPAVGARHPPAIVAGHRRCHSPLLSPCRTGSAGISPVRDDSSSHVTTTSPAVCTRRRRRRRSHALSLSPG